MPDIITLDLETAHSAAELPTGWNDKRALGLSIGAYHDSADDCIHWFDTHTLAETVTQLVARHPMLVSFNGIGFDFPLMRALLRDMGHGELADAFKTLCSLSYDLLAEAWAVDATSKYVKGLNSLGALCVANALPQKQLSGELAPQLWQAGRHAEVLNYCQDDVMKTRALMLAVRQRQGTLFRRTGPLEIRYLGSDGVICPSARSEDLPF